MLSDQDILRELNTGKVVIYPFHLFHLGNCSYDVSLGGTFYREAKPRAIESRPKEEPQETSNGDHDIPPPPVLASNDSDVNVFNPYSEQDVNSVWDGPLVAKKASEHSVFGSIQLKGISPDDLIIPIGPGETVLCHTIEYIGCSVPYCPQISARSSIARSHIRVCNSSGVGDMGFMNRWAVEVTNTSRYYTIPLVVGRRFAKVCFYRCDDSTTPYGSHGDSKYQSSTTLKEIHSAWKPTALLPKLYTDRDIGRSLDDVKKHEAYPKPPPRLHVYQNDVPPPVPVQQQPQQQPPDQTMYGLSGPMPMTAAPLAQPLVFDDKRPPPMPKELIPQPTRVSPELLTQVPSNVPQYNARVFY
jgi:deoxycytidine triphosphate deaminase